MPGREIQAIYLILTAVLTYSKTPYRIWQDTRIPRLDKVLGYTRLCEDLGYLRKVSEAPYHKNGKQTRREYFITPDGLLFIRSLAHSRIKLQPPQTEPPPF